MSLNYTPLRHKMLAEIDAGGVSIGDRNEWVFRSWPSTVSQMARACNWLWEWELIGVYREPGELQISDAGQRCLAQWTTRYGVQVRQLRGETP